MTKTNKKAAPGAPIRFHIDKRAGAIASAATGDDDDELMSTAQVAKWFGVSKQWLEIRRRRGDGPPFERLGPRCIRYRRAVAKIWLGKRSHSSTGEYI